MLILGIDFTSAPSRRKPITCARGQRRAGQLTLESIEALTDFDAFTRCLEQPGPWVAGLDFPFGQPRSLVEARGWPSDWAGYVTHIGAWSMAEFEVELAAFRASRPPGHKHPLRLTDKLAQACSPLMLFGVPVGRMFFRGAPRLLRSGVSVRPGQPTGDPRLALEAYPKLVARRWVKGGYKHDTRTRQTEAQAEARRGILRGLRSTLFRDTYGFEVTLPRALGDALIEDPSGDRLDAALCAVQAAWAAGQPGYGVPAHADAREGWIVDPALLNPTKSVPRPSSRRPRADTSR